MDELLEPKRPETPKVAWHEGDWHELATYLRGELLYSYSRVGAKGLTAQETDHYRGRISLIRELLALPRAPKPGQDNQ